MKVRLTLLFLCLSLGAGFSQIGFEDPFLADTSLVQKDSLAAVAADTSDVFRFLPGNPYLDFTLEDTLLGDYFMQYDPIRKGPGPMGHLGNLGMPAAPLIYRAPRRQGFHLGLDAFEYLHRPLDSLLFYRTGQAFTRATFTQGANQENTAIDVEFGREFADDVGLSLYLNQMANQGPYIHQRAKLSSFGLGIWLQPSQKGYQAFLLLNSNINTVQLNGGLVNEPASLETPIAIPVSVNSAETRYETRELGLIQHLRLFATEQSKRSGQMDLVHDLRYRKSVYKFFDPSPRADSSFYGVFQTDQRGLRNFIDHQFIRNAVKLHFFNSIPPDSTGMRQQRLRWEAGLAHTYHWWNEEVADSSLHNLFATFQLRWPIGKKGMLEGNAHLGLLGANLGDYRAEGRWFLPLGTWGGLEAHAANQRYSPGLLEHRLYVSQQPLWNNNFTPTIHTNLGGALSVLNNRVKLSGDYHLLNFLTYFDSLGFARQTALPISVLQLQLWSRFKLGPLGFDNAAGLQTSTQDFIRLPAYYGTHSLYIQGFIFKKAMLTRLGLDLRLTGNFTPYGFQVVTGQFFLQDGPAIAAWQPLLDASLAVKVRKFRFLFRMENILPAFTQRYYYLAAGYPVPHMSLRVGISWQFVD